jgi:hypothetical protein
MAACALELLLTCEISVCYDGKCEDDCILGSCAIQFCGNCARRFGGANCLCRQGDYDGGSAQHDVPG